jgi:hypothetical protein
VAYDQLADVRAALFELQVGFDHLRGFESIKGMRDPSDEPRVDDAPETLAAIRAIDAAITRTTALLNFEVHGRQGEPFYEVSFGSVPRKLTSPLVPSLVAVRGREPYLDRLVTGLEAALVEIVWMADCQESIDAINTSMQYLYAAGTLASIEPHVLVLAQHLVP